MTVSERQFRYFVMQTASGILHIITIALCNLGLLLHVTESTRVACIGTGQFVSKIDNVSRRLNNTRRLSCISTEISKQKFK